jgi:hypothetical protein
MLHLSHIICYIAADSLEERATWFQGADNALRHKAMQQCWWLKQQAPKCNQHNLLHCYSYCLPQVQTLQDCCQGSGQMNPQCRQLLQPLFYQPDRQLCRLNLLHTDSLDQTNTNFAAASSRRYQPHRTVARAVGRCIRNASSCRSRSSISPTVSSAGWLRYIQIP